MELPPPALLSETGCLVDGSLDPALLPYEINAPFFSDHAEKQRYLLLPEGASLAQGTRGDLALPPGGMAVKTFALDGEPVEVRFAVRDDQGEFHAYTYVWREDGSEADLVTEGAMVGTWEVPSSEDCLRCHQDVTGYSIGLELPQLNRTARYGDVEADQLATLRAIGALIDLAPPDEIDAIPLYDDPDPQSAARSWLHSNCAYCHRPGGGGAGGIDLRWDVVNTRLCDELPEFGDPLTGESPFVDPGVPENSVLVFRVETDDPTWRMPPLGRATTDPEGTALLYTWVEEMDRCE